MQSIDRQLVIGVILTIIIIFALLIFIVAVVLLYQRQLREKQKAIFQSVIDAEEKERNRIAKELHDSLGASLSAVKLYYESLMPNISDKEKSELVYKMLSDSCNEVRSISHQMMPQVLIQEGLYTAVRQFCSPFTKIENLHFELNILGEEIRPNSSTTELMLYRILQELINNSIKHSKATEIIVQIMSSKSEIIMSVEDNGIGVSADVLDQSSGLGINNLKSRVKFINGEFNVESSDNQGFVAIIRVPIN